jgi:eukaryotic-like serine/threonine-protein kinase
MDEPNRCRGCGKPRPSDAPAGLCPVCLLKAGQADSGLSCELDRLDLTVSLAPAKSSAFANLAESLGGLPRILLIDTDPGEDASPLIKPRTPEMPAASDRTDRYQLFGEIAHGGMGAVLRGRDVDIGRDLAVKVLLDGHAGNPELVRRFIEEAQIGGQLQHPGVVPIYDVGTFADRRPFFTMKLVKGRTLAGLLQARKDPTDSMPRFLGIFEQVCQTIAYAHARGVIHRDLKPSNIMVGSFGEVQVMDWGLAKVLRRGGVADDAAAGKGVSEETIIATARSGPADDRSQAGSVLGTPAYMAPEQARGEGDRVDERVDVFALGSILCEMLTGEPAFTGRSSAEIQRKAARGEMAAALERLESCGAEPELIGLAKHCLASDRDDRPRSAREVVDAITAHLASVQERLRSAELARVAADARAVAERTRRRLTLALAASIIGTIVSGGGGWFWIERQRRERATRVDLALREAQLLHGQAQQTGDDRDRWIAAGNAANVVEGLRSDARDKATGATITDIVRAVTAGAAEAEKDRQLRERLVDIRSAEADDQDGSTSDMAYASAFRDAGYDVDVLGAQAAGALIKARPSGVSLALAAALDDWSLARRKARPTEKNAWTRLVATAREADPDPLRDRLRQVWSEPDRKARRESLRGLAREADPHGWPAASLTLLAAALAEAGERGAAVELLGRAQIEHPGDVRVNYNLGRELEQVQPPRMEEAIRYYTAARALRAETAHELAHAWQSRGRRDEARAIFEDLTRLRPASSRHWVCLGFLLRSLGDRDAALAALEQAIATSRDAIRLGPDVAEAHFRLGNALAGKGMMEEAVAAYRRAIQLGPDDSRFYTNLANALKAQGKLSEAIDSCRAAIRLKPDNPFIYNNLGVALAGQGKLPEAVAEFRAAIRLKPEYAFAHHGLGNALAGQGKPAEAVLAYRTAIRFQPDLAEAHLGLGTTLFGQGEFSEAAAAFRDALRFKPDDALAHVNLGNALIRQGKFAEVITLSREAIRLQPDYAEAHANLGVGLRTQGDFAAALDEFHKARDLAGRDAERRLPGITRVLAHAERKAALAARLPGVLRGQEIPKDAAETLEFADLSYRAQRYATAARLFADAFRADPKLAEDMNAGNRYNAACACAMAAAGKGQDQPSLDEPAKIRSRQQGIDWLKADFAYWTKQVSTGPPEAKAFVHSALRHWKSDPDLAGIRDEPAVKALTEAEQVACRTLWTEVDELLKGSAARSP